MAKLRSAAAWMLVLVATFFLANAIGEARILVLYRDADAFIHLRLAALVDAHGTIDRIPQAEDIAWSESFSDKEFLFHELLALGHALGGMAGAVQVQYAIIALFYATLMIGLKRWGGWAGLLVGVLTVVSTYYLQPRVFVLRPQSLAMTAFLWLLLAAMAGRPRWIFVCCALFSLSYHAVYIPLFVVSVASGVAWLLGERRWGLALGAGISGVALGVLVNPYFPGNLMIGLDALQILLRRAPTMDLVGIESRPLGMASLLDRFGSITAVFLVCALFTGVAAVRAGPARLELVKARLLLLGIGLVTLPLLALNPRACEYFVPTVVLMAGLTVPLMARRNVLWLGLGLLPVGLNLWRVMPYYALEKSINPRALSVEQALRAIPTRPAGAAGPAPKVLGCTWPLGGYVFYFRPDLRFSDMLDPYLLYQQHPEKYRAREELKRESADRYGLIKQYFAADYVLCESVFRMGYELDPSFQRVYPENPSSDARLQLFRLSETRPEEQVVAFDYRIDPGDGAARGTAASPETATFDSPLFRLQAGELSDGDCAVVEPTEAESRRVAGGRRLGIGGKGSVTLRLNGEAVYRTDLQQGWTLARLLDLPEPLLASDRLSATVCPFPDSYLSFWLSVWTDQGFRERCERPGLVDLYCRIGPVALEEIR